MNTTKYVFGLAAAAAVALGTSGASAQSSAPVSRESVKAETKASGSLAPAGQGPGANESGNTGRSTKTRAQRKSEAVMERDMGGLTPAGVGGVKPDHMNPVTKPAKSRAAVKGETEDAAKARTLQPAGETPQPSSEAPKK